MINENIYRIRKEKRMTQEALALKIGTSVRNVASWESGAHTMSVENLIKVCKALEVSSDYLLGLTGVRK